MQNPVMATSIDIYAYDHSLNNTPLHTGIYLNAGDILSISVAEDDYWQAGTYHRESNANGLGLGNPAPDAWIFSKLVSGTSAYYYGSLVGQINGGKYFLVGTSYYNKINISGELRLLYWDSNYSDNSGYVTADVQVSPVPEPATLGLLGLGMLGTFMFARFRKKA